LHDWVRDEKFDITEIIANRFSEQLPILVLARALRTCVTLPLVNDSSVVTPTAVNGDTHLTLLGNQPGRLPTLEIKYTP
jgi:hypothetical protein